MGAGKVGAERVGEGGPRKEGAAAPMSVSDELQTGEDVLALSFADVTVLRPELHGVLAPGVGGGDTPEFSTF